MVGLPEGKRDLTLLTHFPPSETPEQLWNGFYTGYNQTRLGQRVQRIVHALRECKRSGFQRVDVVGIGQAGLWALLARGLSGVEGKTIIDTAGFPNASDDAYIPALYAPGLRRAGDLRTAALLAAPSPLCLYNTGDTFQTDTIAAAFRALRAPLRVEKGALSAKEIADWLRAEE